MQYANMGYANIPPDPTAAGVCRVELDMDEEDMSTTVDTLRLMVDKLIGEGEEQGLVNELSGLNLRSANGVVSGNISSNQSDMSSFFPSASDAPTLGAFNALKVDLPAQFPGYPLQQPPIPSPATSVPGQLFSQPQPFSLGTSPAHPDPESFAAGFVPKMGLQGAPDQLQQISALDPVVPDFRVANAGLSAPRPAPLLAAADPLVAPPQRQFKEPPIPTPTSPAVDVHAALASTSQAPAPAAVPQPAPPARPWGQSYAQVGAPHPAGAKSAQPAVPAVRPAAAARAAAGPSPPPRNQSPITPAYSAAGQTYAQRTLPEYANAYASPVPASVQPPPPPPPRTAAPYTNIIQPPPPPPPRRTAAAVAAQGPPAATPSVTRPAPSPAPARAQEHARAPGWVRCYATDGEDHNKDPVQSMVYCASFEGLPGGDGHGGWLISASRHQLNLWECSAGGGSRGQPSLQVMHSQMTDFLSSSLSIESATQLLFAASVDTAKGTECVSVHSLSAEAGFLAYKYRFALGDDKGSRGKTGPQLQQVVSLHPLGSHLRNCCAASCGNKIYILEAAAHASSTPLQRPKLDWKAHDSLITALHCSHYGNTLLSGAQDGSIHIWNMKEPRPVQPMKKLSHAAPVSGLYMVNDHLLTSGAHDGKVLLWDLRMGASPMQTANPDGSAVLKLVVSPIGDCLAVSTTKGLYCVDLIDYSGVVSPITDKPLAKPYNSIEWNTSTLELYACGIGGTINVYKQRY